MVFRLFSFKRSTTAPVAKDRLKVLLAHERAVTGRPDLVKILREEILTVIRKHVEIDQDKVNVRADSSGKVSTLSVDIELANTASAAKAA